MSLYTVEQVELMRRLRLSGITTQQIIDAFDALDRLERELAPFQNHQLQLSDMSTSAGGVASTVVASPKITSIKTLASPYDSLLSRFARNGVSATGAIGVQNHNHQNRHPSSRRKRSIPNVQFPSALQQQQSTTTPNLDDDVEELEHFGDITTSNNETKESENNLSWIDNQQNLDESRTPGLIVDEHRSLMQRERDRMSMPELELLDFSGRNKSTTTTTQQQTPARRAAKRRRSDTRSTSIGNGHHQLVVAPLSIDYSQYVSENQLEEFKSRGEVEALIEIKDFVTARQVRQQTIAIMTGISQPYVSRFLSGVGNGLSSRVRTLMYKWYLAVKAHPDLATGTELAQNQESGPPTMVSVNGNSLFPSSNNIASVAQSNHFSNSIFHNNDATSRNNSSQASSSPGKDVKRERFIFKPAHVRLLNKYFATDPYPSIKVREEIAAACNKVYETADGTSSLPHREQVNSQVVGNWFSNRRKEKKRTGEMKLRRIRGARFVPGVRRVETKPLLSTADYEPLSPATDDQSGASTSHMPSISNILSELKADTSYSGDGAKRAIDLANIVSELHAMNNNGGGAAADSYEDGVTSAITLQE